MPRLTIPEPEIKLYEEGFTKEKDLLDRKETGKRLSDLVERIDDPITIALDGAWGSGKSFFLKCWVGAHRLQNGGKAMTVYFDAFETDFLDDPLIALTAAISERIEREPESTAAKTWKVAKNAAPLLGKAAIRLGTAALVGKAISLTGDDDGALNDIGDKLAEEGGEISKALGEFWKKEDGKRAAMQAFKDALIELTEPNDGSPTQKLVIVVDELDRCRPDYALSLLEIIKHFFAVPGVHFVLGVNLKELENSVRARYGSNVSAAKYLQKFVNIRFTLPVSSHFQRNKNSAKYFQTICEEMDLYGMIPDLIYDILKQIPDTSQPSLREVQQIASTAAICPFRRLDSEVENLGLAILMVLQTCSPSLLQECVNGTVTPDSFRSFFGAGWRGRTRFGAGEIAGHLYWIPELVASPETILSTEITGAFETSQLRQGNRDERRLFFHKLYEENLAYFSFDTRNLT